MILQEEWHRSRCRPRCAGAFAWSPDGRRLALVEVCGDLSVWDAATSRLFARAGVGFGKGASQPAFTGSGESIIAICGDESSTSEPFRFTLWNPATTRPQYQPIPDRSQRPAGKITVSPDGRNLADAGDGRPGLWDPRTMQRRFLLVGHHGSITDLAFAPDSRTLATAGVDGTVRLWSIANGHELLVLDGGIGKLGAVAFSHNGRILASCGDGPDRGIDVIAWYTESFATGIQPGRRKWTARSISPTFVRRKTSP